jgi:hypothetical protein
MASQAAPALARSTLGDLASDNDTLQHREYYFVFFFASPKAPTLLINNEIITLTFPSHSEEGALLLIQGRWGTRSLAMLVYWAM